MAPRRHHYAALPVRARRHHSPALPVCVPDLQDAGAKRHLREKFAYCVSVEDFCKEYPRSESKHIYMDDYNHFYYTQCQGCRELMDEYNALVKAERDGGGGGGGGGDGGGGGGGGGGTPPETQKKPDGGKKRDLPDADDAAASSEAAAKMARAAM